MHINRDNSSIEGKFMASESCQHAKGGALSSLATRKEWGEQERQVFENFLSEMRQLSPLSSSDKWKEVVTTLLPRCIEGEGSLGLLQAILKHCPEGVTQELLKEMIIGHIQQVVDNPSLLAATMRACPTSIGQTARFAMVPILFKLVGRDFPAFKATFASCDHRDQLELVDMMLLRSLLNGGGVWRC